MSTPSAQGTLDHTHKRRFHNTAALRVHVQYTHRGRDLVGLSPAELLALHEELHGGLTYGREEDDES